MSKKFRRTFFISFLCFLLAYSAIGYFIVKGRSEEVLGDDEFEDTGDEVLFLVLGIDGDDLSKAKDTRTDTMMLTKVNFETGKVSILSIPRDTRVNIRGRSGLSKINAAHKFGGPELSVETVRDLLGIDLEYYVKIDYRVVREVVDLIGGVELDVPKDMEYEDPTDDPPLYIDLKKGRQVLDGDKSIQFLRYRKDNNGKGGYKEGDIGRIKAQQQFIKAFVEQSLKMRNILKLPRMASKYYKYVETNMPINIVTKGAKSARKMDAESINATTLPGEGKYIGGVSYFIYYEGETDILVEEMFGKHSLQ